MVISAIAKIKGQVFLSFFQSFACQCQSAGNRGTRMRKFVRKRLLENRPLCSPNPWRVFHATFSFWGSTMYISIYMALMDREWDDSIAKDNYIKSWQKFADIL